MRAEGRARTLTCRGRRGALGLRSGGSEQRRRDKVRNNRRENVNGNLKVLDNSNPQTPTQTPTPHVPGLPDHHGSPARAPGTAGTEAAGAKGVLSPL